MKGKQDTGNEANKSENRVCSFMKPYLQNLVLLSLIDFTSQTAVSQSILDDMFVRLGTGLFVQFWTCEKNKEYT